MEVEKYVVIHKETTKVVAQKLQTRRQARVMKAALELSTGQKHFVETGKDNPNGAGIYIH
jgi:hypothetical protein